MTQDSLSLSLPMCPQVLYSFFLLINYCFTKKKAFFFLIKQGGREGVNENLQVSV